MPRKCTICSHEQTRRINLAISAGGTLRKIAKQFDVSDSAVFRHVETCLSLSLSALIEKKQEKQAINVHKEFEANLAFAQKLRVAAEEYLANPIDPLRLAIIPRADEIDVVYYETWGTVDGDGPPVMLERPVKKTAKLSMLLRSIAELRNIEVDKVNIKHMDLRRFALDSIEVTDKCVDRFAKLAGAYQQDRPNERDAEIARLIDQIKASAAENGTTYEQERDIFLKNYANQLGVRPEIQDRLASEEPLIG